MKISRVIPLFFCLLATATVAKAEGEVWWWDCKDDDFIVSAQVDYGTSPYFTISWQDEKGEQRTSYYLLGKLNIEKFLYINSHSRYLDAYKYYLREKPKEIPVLIQAHRVYASDMKEDVLRVAPDSTTIGPPNRTGIMALNQNYMYPIGHLFLESVVPAEAEKTAKELIEERKDNLLVENAPPPAPK